MITCPESEVPRRSSQALALWSWDPGFDSETRCLGHRCIFSEITVADRFRHNVGALNNSQAGSLPYVDSDPVPVGEGEVGALNEALGREFSPMLRETQCECRNPKDNEVDLLTFSHLKKNKVNTAADSCCMAPVVTCRFVGVRANSYETL